MIFLAVGDQPALPLSRLEAMEDKALNTLFERFKDSSSAADDVPEGEEGGGASSESPGPGGEEVGTPDRDAPPASWTPKRPEKILALTVCDPACGSGTFPLAALRFLTDSLYASLQHHGRIEPDGERSLVRLLGLREDGTTYGGTLEAERAQPGDEGPEAVIDTRLGDELIPCPPEDERFEPRLKAVLRRHVVERCIYAVDLDPLAVELCRLSLGIETMDRTLPFGFLDHKVKCGNALVGAWFDQFRHYPVMAWKNREGGDKNHTNGVHFEKEARTKAIKSFVKDRLTPDLKLFLSAEESWRECHLHARNLLGAHEYALLLVEQIERSAAAGEGYFALLKDGYTRKLLGDAGYVTVLFEIRARSVVDEDSYWTTVGALRADGHLDDTAYGQLLDELHARGRLDDLGYRRRRAYIPPSPSAERWLRVAEEPAEYRANTPPKNPQPDLFE